MSREDLLVWIDLEMTSLTDAKKDSIIEIASIITDQQLNIIAEGPDVVIHADESVFASIPAEVQEIHAASGIIPLSVSSTTTEHEAEQETLMFLKEYALEKTAPLCGSSIHVDRMFLKERMPLLESFFFYRNIDVSTVSALSRYFKPELYEAYKLHFEDSSKAHRAKDDILYSIEKLKFYKQTLFAA